MSYFQGMGNKTEPNRSFYSPYLLSHTQVTYLHTLRVWRISWPLKWINYSPYPFLMKLRHTAVCQKGMENKTCPSTDKNNNTPHRFVDLLCFYFAPSKIAKKTGKKVTLLLSPRCLNVTNSFWIWFIMCLWRSVQNIRGLFEIIQ